MKWQGRVFAILLVFTLGNSFSISAERIDSGDDVDYNVVIRNLTRVELLRLTSDVYLELRDEGFNLEVREGSFGEYIKALTGHGVPESVDPTGEAAKMTMVIFIMKRLHETVFAIPLPSSSEVENTFLVKGSKARLLSIKALGYK